jgi:hypothetical protein
MSDLTIDVTYIGRLSTRLDQFKKVRRDVWNARCPICGDSKKKKYKKRFYIFLNKGKYFTKCHNCSDANYEFSFFLKIYHPDLYKEYLIDKLPQKTSLKKNRFKHIKDIIPKKIRCKGFDYGSLKRFDKLDIKHFARIYAEKRKIPLDSIYYADQFSTFINRLDIEHYKLSYINSHEPRMIIPFYREDGLSTVFQARSFSKTEGLRYITIKEDEQESKIFGLDRIDKSKPVYCVEGPIDSLMIPNCIAMSGIATQLPKGINNFIFIFDNEPRNTDVVKNMRKRLRQGHGVVIMPDRIKFDDLNEMRVQGKMSSKKILDIIKSNIYTDNIGIMKLMEWSKL